VNDITTDGSYLYAATKLGIYKADINDPNLLDFNAWDHMTSLPDPDSSYQYIVAFNDKLFTLYRSTSGFDQVITFDENGWNIWEHSSNDHFEYIGEQKGYLVLSSAGQIKLFNGQETPEREIVSYYARYVLLDANMGLWYAALFGGLVMVDAAGNGTLLAAEGPAYRDEGYRNCCRMCGLGRHIKIAMVSYGAYSTIGENGNITTAAAFRQ
jgi:hypothetical protein